jgi:hypothetical protein
MTSRVNVVFSGTLFSAHLFFENDTKPHLSGLNLVFSGLALSVLFKKKTTTITNNNKYFNSLVGCER